MLDEYIKYRLSLMRTGYMNKVANLRTFLMRQSYKQAEKDLDKQPKSNKNITFNKATPLIGYKGRLPVVKQ